MHYVRACQNTNCRFGEKDCWYNHTILRTTSEVPTLKHIGTKTKTQSIQEKNILDFPNISPKKAPDQQKDIMDMIKDQNLMIQKLVHQISNLEKKSLKPIES